MDRVPDRELEVAGLLFALGAVALAGLAALGDLMGGGHDVQLLRGFGILAGLYAALTLLQSMSLRCLAEAGAALCVAAIPARVILFG